MLRLLFYSSIFSSVIAISNLEQSHCLNEFLERQAKPGYVVSFIKTPINESVKTCKDLSENKLFFKIKRGLNLTEDRVATECHKHFYYRGTCNIYDFLNLTNTNYDNILYLADLQDENTIEILSQAEKVNMILNPSRWLLFYKSDENKTIEDVAKQEVNMILKHIYIAINTEVYVAFDKGDKLNLFLVHKRSRQAPLAWEDYGSWHPSGGFNRPAPTVVLSMRRRNLQGLNVSSTGVVFNKDSFKHMPDYLHREVDTLTKVLYYMSIHLFEWVNATGHLRSSKSWGYLKPDGTYDGTVRDLWDGVSDFSGSVLITMKDRLPAVNYIMSPAPINVLFIYRKPSLASVANIYSLPFSSGVWISIVLLVLVSSLALFFTSYREVELEQYQAMTISQRCSQGFHDTLCLVFQQGTAIDPISVSSRQILILGLLAFMFLFTAYSANVVALLQSATNDINSVETLLNSPLQCGAQDVVYNREIFKNENRPIHRSLWQKKGLPQGDSFFLSVEEGIRKVREGMYAFQVEPTAGYDQVKTTFLEHEKCNLGTVKYTDFLFPYIGVARNSHIKEVLRVGVLRILESGIQSRTNLRILSARPHCGAGAAMFTAVSLMDVAPAFKAMFIFYAVALLLFALEIFTSRRSRNRFSQTQQNVDFTNKLKYTI